jgi:hypothetical protein
MVLRMRGRLDLPLQQGRAIAVPKQLAITHGVAPAYRLLRHRRRRVMVAGGCAMGVRRSMAGMRRAMTSMRGPMMRLGPVMVTHFDESMPRGSRRHWRKRRRHRRTRLHVWRRCRRHAGSRLLRRRLIRLLGGRRRPENPQCRSRRNREHAVNDWLHPAIIAPTDRTNSSFAPGFSEGPARTVSSAKLYEKRCFRNDACRAPAAG